jgi:tRNA-dihydrouridine synthase B
VTEFPLKPLLIGNLSIDPPLLLAPMAGVTDPPFRQRVGEEGDVGLMFSEMIPCRLEKKKIQQKVLGKTSALGLLAIQLLGNDPVLMAEAAKFNVEVCGAQWIDLNFGCPVAKVVRNFAGAALLQNLPRAAQIMQAVVEAVPVPVTVKTRLGWDSSSINVNSLAKIAEDCGVQLVTVHGRTRHQFYGGGVNWSCIASIKDKVKIPIVVNGDITTKDNLQQALIASRADGVMIGRGAWGRPWIFRQLLTEISGKSFESPTIRQRRIGILHHMQLLREYYPGDNWIGVFRKHLNWYSKGFPGAAEFRARINQWRNSFCLQQEIENFFGGC